MARTVLLALLAALALGACGKTPTQATHTSRGLDSAITPAAPATAPVGTTSGTDPRIAPVMALTAKLRATSTTADSTIMFHYVRSNGTKEWLHSRYKYQKPRRNAVELMAGSDTKVAGTKLVWTGESEVKVHTKFIGFWLNVSLPLADDRLKDPTDYRIDQTSIDKVFDTILCAQNQVSFVANGTVAGKPVTVISVVSPLSLKPATREVFGLETATGTPLLREMYKGSQLYYKMEVEKTTLNPHLTSADFEVS